MPCGRSLSRVNSGKVKIQKGGKEEELAETGRGGEKGEEQKGKLVHAMIMVVNQKKRQSVAKQNKQTINIAKQN